MSNKHSKSSVKCNHKPGDTWEDGCCSQEPANRIEEIKELQQQRLERKDDTSSPVNSLSANWN